MRADKRSEKRAEKPEVRSSTECRIHTRTVARAPMTETKCKSDVTLLTPSCSVTEKLHARSSLPTNLIYSLTALNRHPSTSRRRRVEEKIIDERFVFARSKSGVAAVDEVLIDTFDRAILLFNLRMYNILSKIRFHTLRNRSSSASLMSEMVPFTVPSKI